MLPGPPGPTRGQFREFWVSHDVWSRKWPCFFKVLYPHNAISGLKIGNQSQCAGRKSYYPLRIEWDGDRALCHVSHGDGFFA
jgi:hypothetical protein